MIVMKLSFLIKYVALASKLYKKIFEKIIPDQFPKLTSKSVIKKGRKTPEFNKIDDFKALFWTTIAKRTKSLSLCYSKNLPTNAPQIAVEMLSRGYGRIDNYLTETEQEIVIKSITNKISRSDKDHLSEWARADEKIEQLIQVKLNELTNFFFNKSVQARGLYHYERSLSGNLTPQDTDPHVVDWHADRYIPFIKAIYFPYGCDWLPYEIVEISPYEYFQKVSKREIKTFHEKLPSQLSKNKIYQSYVPPNTLITSFNMIFHRRGKYSSPGERTAVFLDWTNQFNYIDLIKESILK